MCKSTGVLVFIFLLKILAMIIIPIAIYILNNRIDKKRINLLFFISIFMICIFILLRIFNNDCVINSNLKGININNNKKTKNVLYSKNDANRVEKIITNNIYKNNLNDDVYYFNHDELPLSDKKISCEGRDVYMKNYGNNITVISMALSTLYQKNIDPIEILNLALDNNILDCEIGFNTDELLELISNHYNLNVLPIYKEQINDYIQNGGIVISNIGVSEYSKNMSCGDSYILIYKVNKDGKFSILNPNDKDYDYICPDNSLNYGQVIKANQNNDTYTLAELANTTNRFIVLERK